MKSETLTLHSAISIFEENLEDIKSACMDNMMAILAEEGTGDWVREEIKKLRLEPYVKLHNRIVSSQQVKLSPRTDSITDIMIIRAKEYPIEDMYDGRLRKGCGLCPFHQEKTPSFRIKNNRFQCFGCNEFGDSIAFYMKMNNCNFIQAVRALQ